MIRIAICEDDIFYMEKEKQLIETYLVQKNVKYEMVTFRSSIELTNAYKNSYDLIFMDVAMEEMDGIETAKWLREKGSNSYIVFLTAYSEYLTEGYKVNAHRFLLKNDSNLEEELHECIDSVLEKLRIEGAKINMEVQGGLLSIAPSKIIYAESKAHKVTIHVVGQTGKLREYYMYDTLNHVQEILEEYGFKRTHQSYLINSNYLRDVCRYSAELKGNISLPISKKYYSEIEKFYISIRGEL